MSNVDLLAYRCTNLLWMLILLYEKAEISDNEFKNHTSLKAMFLRDHMDSIEDPTIKKNSIVILDYYKTLVETDSPVTLAYNTQV